jgi:transposase
LSSSTPPRCIFAGEGGATLGQRGYSKDFRPQLHQVGLGIVLNGSDRPIASFFRPGNTADVTTLLTVVERLRSPSACVVPAWLPTEA